MSYNAYSLAILVFRVSVGVTFLAHGINHIWRGGKIAGTGRWFASLGMKPGIFHAWLASLTELGAGTMLILGLLEPLAGAGVLGVMLVAWITNHRKNGFFIFRPGEGYEYVMNLAVAGFVLGTLPAGRWSLDRALDFHPGGWVRLAITVIAGAGGALLLLLVFWRPEKKVDAAT
ncbi:MAG TPA: DoxX family protein [Acidimicrobiia bacterium]